MMLDSLFTEKTKFTFGQSLINSQVKKDLNFKMVLQSSALVIIYIKFKTVQFIAGTSRAGEKYTL